MTNSLLTTIIAGAATAAVGSAAYAQSTDDNPMNASASRIEDWMEMRKEAVSASEIMRGNVSNGLNPFAAVSNLVLSKDGSQVEYVIYNTRYPPWSFYIGDGYVSYNAVKLESGAGVGEIDLQIEADEPVRGPEEIRITADEAERRLVSRITDSAIEFDRGRTHEIEDILIHPKTGAVVAYVVNADEDAIFAVDRLAVPANRVTFRNGEFRSETRVTELEDMQRFDTALL